MDYDSFCARFYVSRETFSRLEVLASLLVKWNKKINLVSNQSLSTLWERHILDSTQLWPLVQNQNQGGHWLDIGSGGGFPGLVIAALNPERETPFDLTLMDSDTRKCSFLRTALREMGVPGRVICGRIESVEGQEADILSARALADLSKLIEFSEIHLKAGGDCILPKGVNWKKEVEEAQESWSFDFEAFKSETQDGAVILKVGDIKRV